MYRRLYDFGYNNFLISGNRYANIVMPILIYFILQKIVHEMKPVNKAGYIFMQLIIILITLAILIIMKEAISILLLIGK
jgi:hypothetical protein